MWKSSEPSRNQAPLRGALEFFTFLTKSFPYLNAQHLATGDLSAIWQPIRRKMHT
jgi:hypothetical protein